MTIVRNKPTNIFYWHMIYAVTQPTKHPRDEEEYRLFGVYEASSAKEHTAASKLLNPHRELSREAYLNFSAISGLYGRNAMKECSQSRRIIERMQVK
jgi:hypothetical protein